MDFGYRVSISSPSDARTAAGAIDRTIDSPRVVEAPAMVLRRFETRRDENGRRVTTRVVKVYFPQDHRVRPEEVLSWQDKADGSTRKAVVEGYRETAGGVWVAQAVERG